MVQVKKIVTGTVAVILITGLIYSCSTPTNTSQAQTSSPQIYGYLFNGDGSPAVNAQVKLVQSDYVPAQSSAKTTALAQLSVDGTTDQNGRYSFSNILPAVYNVYGYSGSDSTVSYSDKIVVSSLHKDTCITKDTLSAPGTIKGVVNLFPPSDNRKMLILVLGSNLIRWPDDATGNFTIKNLAKGKYRIRFLPTDPVCPVLDTTFAVEAGKTTDIGTICIGCQLYQDTLKAYQAAYVGMKLGALINFNMSTFTRNNYPDPMGEWELGKEDENLFNPESLNCGQWADAAKSAGCGYIVLSVKCNGGFCLWNSSTTTHDIGSCSWGNGKRDVVREFVDSAKSRGLQVGFYYSVRDNTNPQPPRIVVKAQLTELLTNYGPVNNIHFDGWGWYVGYNQVPFDTVKHLVKSLQPTCLIIENNHRFSLYNTELAEYEIPLDGPVTKTNGIPAEGFEPIRVDNCWFWHPGRECDLKTAQYLVNELNVCNARNATYMINLSPDTTGLLPQCQIDRMKEVGLLR